MPEAINPWTLDAKDFLSQVNPLMDKAPTSMSQGWDSDAIAVNKQWHQQDSTPQDVTLTLADGRKWTPSGAENGIVFHPKGEVTQGKQIGMDGGWDGTPIYEQVKNPEDYYEVSGDASRLMGKDQSGQKVTVRYKQVGDKMVPMEDATYDGYKQGLWENGFQQFAMMGAMAVGGWALAPAAGAGAGAAVAGTAAAGTAATAAGAAGWMGMAPGLAATAVNTGLINAGVSLATGHNIGDSIKSGVAAGALSGVGGWANEAIGSATSGLGATTSKVLSTVGSGAVTGAAGAALTGQDVGKGALNGVISSGISAAGNVASNATKGLIGEVTDSKTAGNIAGGLVNSAITGSSPIGVLVGEVTGKIDGFNTLTKEQQATVNSVIAQAVKGKKLSTQQLIDLAASATKKVKES